MAIPYTPSSHSGITIKIHPFESPACHRLVTALDTENDALYPDHADFAYEGPGNWLTGVPSANPVPYASKDDPGTVHDTEQVVWQNEHPAEMQAAEDAGEMFIFVAFPKSIDQHTETEVTDDNAIGCIGVKLLPYFPYHRKQATTDCESSSTEPRTAEVKRLYVVPSYRGRSKSNAANGTEVSVALLLLRHAEVFARERMGVKRLILETGARQYAAISLYQKNGYARCKEFGDYIGAGEDVGGLSRCFEKWL